jgi:hypothetical protein
VFELVAPLTLMSSLNVVPDNVPWKVAVSGFGPTPGAGSALVPGLLVPAPVNVAGPVCTMVTISRPLVASSAAAGTSSNWFLTSEINSRISGVPSGAAFRGEPHSVDYSAVLGCSPVRC